MGVTNSSGVSTPTTLTNLDNIRQAKIDNPLLHLFKTNNIADVSAPLNTDADVTWLRSTVKNIVDRYGVVQQIAVDTPTEEADGFLIEGASTNLILRSEELDNATWLKAGDGAITPNDTAAPDGAVTADKFTGTDGDANRFDQTVSITDTGQDILLSIYAKADTSDNFKIRFISAGGTAQDSFISFDLLNGTASIGGTITALANGWFRCSRTVSLNNTGNTSVRMLISQLDTGSQSLFFWGAQLEELSFVTSYIITTTAAVTRTADIPSVVVLDNLPQISTSICVVYDLDGFSGNNNFLVSTGAGGIDFFFNISDNGNIIARWGGTRLEGTPALDNRERQRVSLVVTATTASLYADGELIDSGANTVIFPEAVTPSTAILRLGNAGVGVNPLYGILHDLRIYDFALNADEIKFLGGA